MSLRNLCIIAHVDHGKTTLVDHLLRQGGTYASHQRVTDRVMDSMDLERERGITIMAKNTSITLGQDKINIVDTPGHADFGGEVERIMGMVDGALLLVDAAEGPLPQTRFVLRKALDQGLRVILVINKVDRPDARIDDVVNKTFDLFIDLGANEEQADFPIVYACARAGWCTTDRNQVEGMIAGTEKGTLSPLFDVILKEVPKPKVETDGPLRMLISNLAYSDYVGRLAIGRLQSGIAKKGSRIFRYGYNPDGSPKKTAFNITMVYTYDGLKMVEVPELLAGDIGVLAGNEEVEIGDSFLAGDDTLPLPRIKVDPPTIGMIFSVNASPLAGQEGEAMQSRKLRDRLLREVRNNVALRFEETSQPDQFRVLGRGELQFAILIEQIRREGFEIMVGKPTVLMQTDESGAKLEPMEKLVLDLPETAVGDVTGLFQSRKGIMTLYDTGAENGTGRVRLEFEIPTRGLLGMRSRYLTITRGEGLLSSIFLGYGPHKGEISHRNVGSLVCDRTGKSVEYALLSLEERGILFIGPGIDVYEGMIIGEHAKDDDLNVNPCKEKKLTNIRSAGAEFLVTLNGIKKMSLEQCLDWIDEDEWIEVTPENVRLRKKVLQANMRSVKRSERVKG